jgi:hypothetical protein
MPALVPLNDGRGAGTACSMDTKGGGADASLPPPPAPLAHAWSIPAVWEAPAPAVAAPAELTAYETLLAGAARAETLPSTLWTPAHLARLADASTGLVRDRNRFVCLQLLTMAREQAAKAAIALASGDSPGLAAARAVFLSTLEAEGRVVGAALHYPRARSKAAAAGAGGAGTGLVPHMYVELICTNEPGHGWGSVLLQHGERAGRDCICRGPASPPADTPCEGAACASSAPAKPPASEPCRQHPLGQPTPSNTPLRRPSPAAVEAFALSNAAALLSAALSADAPAAPGCCPKSLSGIKLLSVESAMHFYAANGFSEPDAAHEMFKPLSSIGRGLLLAAG